MAEPTDTELLDWLEHWRQKYATAGYFVDMDWRGPAVKLDSSLREDPKGSVRAAIKRAMEDYS